MTGAAPIAIDCGGEGFTGAGTRVETPRICGNRASCGDGQVAANGHIQAVDFGRGVVEVRDDAKGAHGDVAGDNEPAGVGIGVSHGEGGGVIGAD